MSAIKCFLCLLLCMAMTAPPALAETTGQEAAFRGWSEKKSYQYVSFGRYPETDICEVKPLLWRVLATNEQGEALLLTEYVIDMYPIIWVEDEKDREEHNFRAISDITESDLYTWMNSTMTETMFTEEETTALNAARGTLFLLNRTEYCTVDYGFTRSVYGKQTSRICSATGYAKIRGVYQERGVKGTTYWLNDLSPGNPWRMSIVGMNGHISYAGCARQNVGVRPACLVKMDRVSFTAGDGTKENPYVISVKVSPAPESEQ